MKNLTEFLGDVKNYDKDYLLLAEKRREEKSCFLSLFPSTEAFIYLRKKDSKHHANFFLFSLSGFQTLSASDLRDPEISALVAAKLKEFNELDMPGPKNVWLWDRSRYVSFLSAPFTCLKR